MALPPVNDMVQPVSLLPERMATKAEIMRSKIETERKVTNQKILRLQEDLGKCQYDMQIQKDEFRKKNQKYDLLLEDFKKMGLEYEKLKKDQKARLVILPRI